MSGTDQPGDGAETPAPDGSSVESADARPGTSDEATATPADEATPTQPASTVAGPADEATPTQPAATVAGPADEATPTPAAATVAGPPSPEEPEIGWVRAILTGLAVLLVGFAGAVLGANRILTKALGLRRTPREWLATALFFAVVVAVAWILRRLQARKLI